MNNGCMNERLTLTCRLLGVCGTASQAEIKSAYRKTALKTHPDVSDEPDATEKFAQLSNAYGRISQLLQYD